MGLKLRLRTGVIVASALVVAGVIAPSALATTPLSGSKTAEASWTRSYSWTISKSVDKPAIELKSGDSATAKYTVSVVKSAPTDSDVTVKGSVCVKNNGDVATEGLTIRDRIAATVPGGTLTLDVGFIDLSANPVLDPGEEHCYPYSFTIAPRADATEYRNEAQIRITNDPREPGVPLGPSVEAPFTIPAPTLVGDSIDVDDTNGMSWAFSASGSQTYNRTFKCDQDKGTHSNTARIRQTGASASASVTVTCKPKPQECKDRDKDKGKKDDKKKGKKDDDRDRRGSHGSYGGHDDDDCKGDRDDKDDWWDHDDRDRDKHDDRDCRDDRRGWRD
jgi:hypothetical protein